MTSISKIKWKDANFKWGIANGDAAYEQHTGHIPFTWDEVFLVQELVTDVSGGGAAAVAYDVNRLDLEKKKRFIKLVCKVKGIETYSGQKTIREDIEITAEDIELVVKEVLGIDLKVENIHV